MTNPGQRAQDVVDRLHGDGVEPPADTGRDLVDLEVPTFGQHLKHGDPRPGHSQAVITEKDLGGHLASIAPRASESLKGFPLTLRLDPATFWSA